MNSLLHLLLVVSVAVALLASPALAFRAHSPSDQSTSPRLRSSTRLFAALQFKNVAEMLDTFVEEPVLIAFTNMNCGPCKLQRKELASAKSNLPLTIVAIDTDRWPTVGSRFQVGKLPCLVAFQNGKELMRMDGLTASETIIRNIQSLQRC